MRLVIFQLLHLGNHHPNEAGGLTINGQVVASNNALQDFSGPIMQLIIPANLECTFDDCGE